MSLDQLMRDAYKEQNKMSKYKITLISDTHTKHNQLSTTKSLRNADQPLDLPGGDILIHAGDFMSSGYDFIEAREFFKWFDEIDNYGTKIFIAGNHDRIMENDPEWAKNALAEHKTIEYLQDEECVLYFDGHNGDMPEENVRIYGSPWQPWFHDWAFNLTRNGEELKAKWDAIPTNTDILITHGPVWGKLDTPGGSNLNVGCELLAEHINTVSRPKIHVCGHIHGSYGYYFDGHTHYFNASVLDERYNYTNSPWNFEWDNVTNEITWM
jgi:Icc-related predicted phosphoesterase